tara:strand:- start:380 stop:616 length:237 start_codon:yes stop_codon:yes gene_type:complete
MITIIQKSGKQPELKQMQTLVDGRIERHPERVVIDNSSYDVIVNEEGLINNLPINEQMFEDYGLTIFGNAILLEGGLR